MSDESVQKAVLAERERCAKRCEHYADDVRHGLGLGRSEEEIERLSQAALGCAAWVREGEDPWMPAPGGDLKTRLLARINDELTHMIRVPSMFGESMATVESMFLQLLDYRDLIQADGLREGHHQDRPYWLAYRNVLVKHWGTGSVQASVHIWKTATPPMDSIRPILQEILDAANEVEKPQGDPTV